MSTTGAQGQPHGADPDDRLLDELRRVIAQVDPVPADVLAAARAAFAVRDLDEELALLVADSHAGGLAPVRAALAARLLAFESPGGGVELELTSSRGRVDLQGQVLGGTQGRLAVEHVEGVEQLDVDELGRFSAQALPGGRLRVRWVDAAGRRTVTPWVEA